MVSPADLVRWSGQVEGEVRRVVSKVDELFDISPLFKTPWRPACHNTRTSRLLYSSSWTTSLLGATPLETAGTCVNA